MKTIILAGGCFWGIEAYFKRVKGVKSTLVGYAGGFIANPTYAQVCSGNTGHAEVCKITYDDTILSLNKILEHFFKIIDPTSLNKQGNDVGSQYRTMLFYNSIDEKETMLKFIKKIQANYSKPILVQISPFINFYTAETYHQEYLEKNPGGYCHINLNIIKEEELQKPV